MPLNSNNLLEKLSENRKAIMGFAALWIFVIHEWETLFPNIPIISSMEYFVKGLGCCGVDIFFMLSGFGLVFSIENNSTGKYYLNRVKRVYPAFFVVGVCSAIIQGWTLPTFVKTITGITFYTESIYTFLWFIPAVMTLYFLFPLFYKFFSKAANKEKFLAVFVFLWLILSIALGNILREDLYGMINRVPVFVFGVYFGYCVKHKKAIRIKYPVLFAAFCGGCVLYYLTAYRGTRFLIPLTECSIPTMLLGISVPFLLTSGIVWLNKEVPKLGRALLIVLNFYGAFSLEFYAVQEAIGFALKPLLTDLPAICLNAAVLAVTTAAGLLLKKSIGIIIK